ncbi:metallophosphoesterase [Demequina flava]|uniref:metallophosphoesterase n=1 Tax=Demequina flava TaxID=1095025 RepID=UPI0007836300|nr:metallophosphoesterase [Demequina flava]
MNVKGIALTVLAALTAVAWLPQPAAQAATWPPPEPYRHDPLWQVSEIVANSPNVGGGDAYEYVEIRNASDGPLAWDDFRMRYVRPLVDLTTVWAAHWPTLTPDVVVEPGGTLVLWVRNPVNDGLTVADFNAAYGSSLVEGENLVMVDGTGLSNSSLRGVALSTKFGVQLAQAYYNEDGNADAAVKTGVGVHFEPTVEPGGVQERVGTATPSPGVVSQAHADLSPIAQPEPGDAPEIVDDAGHLFTQGRGVEIDAWVGDDGLVHTADIEVWSDIDPEPTVYPLTGEAVGSRTVHLGAADTLGRSEIYYRITASDGTHKTTSDTVTLTSTLDEGPLRIGGGHDGLPLGEDLVVPLFPQALTRHSGDVVAGQTRLVVGGDVYPPQHGLEIDGAEVDTELSLEHEPFFAFEATLTDPYFRNGIVMGDDVLHVFDTGTYSEVETVETRLPLDDIRPGQPVTVSIVAGTKAAPEVDDFEANDDFIAMNPRLALPDGRVLTARGYSEGQLLPMGDGARTLATYEATFDIPDDAFTAVAHEWDTTGVADGLHSVVSRNDAGDTVTMDLAVDNTAPAVETSIADSAVVRGEVTLDATVTDAEAGVDVVTAALDGRAVRLPLEISSLTATPGAHDLTVTATDDAGNVRTVTREFTVPEEHPTVAEAATVSDGNDMVLEATVEDSSGDTLDVDFARGEALAVGDEIQVFAGTTNWSGDTERTEARELAAGDRAAVTSPDAQVVSTTSDSALPYVLLTADVSETQGDQLRLVWNGTAEPDARVTLSLLDPDSGEWSPVAAHVTAAADEDITLEAVVPVSQWESDGEVRGLVQHTEGYAGEDHSTRASAVTPNHPEDTPRSEYDFSLAWESDTQYYNARPDIYDRQLSIHDYVLNVREDINLQYLIHTGDIVDWSTDDEQWDRADAAYTPLDDAGLPYGVLAGNHDVDHRTNDYGPFSEWFGDNRFADNPWFGESHLDNRGHYDLVTAGGIDFLFLYMGWAPGDEQVEWMNDVLSAYPERVAVVSLHEYMLTTGGLGPVPQQIFDEVIATQPTVKFVLSGHYHDAYTRLDHFDDDGDGADDRTVTSMLFDYQDLPYGGQGYLRLMHFDNEAESIQVRTYSDYLSDYTAVHTALDDVNQDFAIPYAQAGITVAPKVLTTDSVSVDVLSDEVIASFDQVDASTSLNARWDEDGSWYVRATDPYGATAVSDVIDGPGGSGTVLTASRD